MSEKDQVFFRNYSSDQVWEISKKNTSMYIPYHIIKADDVKWQLNMLLSAFEIKDLDGIIDTIIKYTDDPQEDMFIVETK